MTYRLISLFSGIGGIDLGFEQTGRFETVAQVELDDYCNRVLERHWPAVQRFRDVREVGRHNLPPCDVLAGGFPCQDLSLAGKGAGLSGSRSGLWWEFHRIIGELRPRVVVVENVPGLFSRGIDRVLGSLAEIGYDAEWEIVSAASQGAPHIRERVWIVAYPESLGWNGRTRNLPEADGRPELTDEGGDVADSPSDFGRVGGKPAAVGPRLDRRGDPERGRRVQDGVDRRVPDLQGFPPGPDDLDAWGQILEADPAAFPSLYGVADGVPKRMDRLKCLGNAVVPSVARFVAQRILASGVLDDRPD